MENNKVNQFNKKQSITIAIPCYNEAVTIRKVINDFREQLPEAEIIVLDNNSSDGTADIARENGARVIYESKQGKGYVVKRMFQVINSDILVMVDGDDTYFADDVKSLIKPVLRGEADMVVGNRLHQNDQGFSYSHKFGNALFRVLLNYFFGTKYKDILSGYRVIRKDFYKNVPLLAYGFEVETELTLLSLDRDYSLVELPIKYKDRPKGSHSKISKFKDGYKIVLTILSLLRDYRPMVFFSYLSGAFIILGIFFGMEVVSEYYRTGFIKRVPTAILSIALIIVGVNALISGLILSALNRRHKETEIIIKQKINSD